MSRKPILCKHRVFMYHFNTQARNWLIAPRKRMRTVAILIVGVVFLAVSLVSFAPRGTHEKIGDILLNRLSLPRAAFFFNPTAAQAFKNGSFFLFSRAYNLDKA